MKSLIIIFFNADKKRKVNIKGSVREKMIRGKLLKTIHTEEHIIHTNSESCNIRLGSLKNQFNFQQIIQILQPIVIDYLSTHSYIVKIL